MILLDGKKTSEKILMELKSRIAKLEKKPKLVVIIVGNNPASELYVKMKRKKALELGLESEIIYMGENTKPEELKKVITDLNFDPHTTGILLQMPIPEHLKSFDFIKMIDPKKDVDGFTPLNLGYLMYGEKACGACTPLGIMALFQEYNINVEKKNVVVIGRSNIVGKPIAQMLLNKNATVTICHSKTDKIEQYTKNADIIISAAGVPNLIKGDMVKEGAVVVDVGISKFEGKLCGDVNFEQVSKVASHLTPVPGGVGPMTIAMLMKNTVDLFCVKM